MSTHPLTTAIVTEPGRLLDDRNKFNRMPRVLFASDISMYGSRIGCPPISHEMLKSLLLDAVSKTKLTPKSNLKIKLIIHKILEK